MALINTEK